MNLRVRDVLQRAGTSNATGVEMCLLYHLKGICNITCAHNGDHKEHTPAEDLALIRWCEAHYMPAE
jgi:hypothetical protein